MRADIWYDILFGIPCDISSGMLADILSGFFSDIPSCCTYTMRYSV